MKFARVSIFATALVFALNAAATSAQGVQRATPQPDPTTLSEGLAVEYYYDDFRDVNLSRTVSKGAGEAGPPLPQLNYQTGIGRVLTSSSSDFVGAKITGFIHLQLPGSWSFKIASNDGARLRIGEVTLFEDMSAHPDYDSNPLPVEIAEAGWYPINVLYYERKRTSTLKLWWKQPGADSYEIVPASAFRH